jgi:hypothetical protein
LLFQCFLIAQHVSGNSPPIIKSSKTVIAASGFTYIFWLPAAAMAVAAITVFELLIMGGV